MGPDMTGISSAPPPAREGETGRGRRTVGFRGRRERERCPPYAYALLGSSERKEAAAPRGWTRVRSWRPGARAGAVVRCLVLGRWPVSLELVQFLDAGPLFVSWIAAHARPCSFR